MPGSRFAFKTSKNLGGHTVQLRHKGLWLSKSDTRAILGQVQRAKGMLSATIAAIYNGVIGSAKTHAATYFLTPPAGPTVVQRQRIMRILELTYGGLNSDVTLKLGVGGLPAYGYVGAHLVEPGSAGSMVLPSGDHVTTQGHTIHISKKRMLRNPDIGVITLIHESTHRFASTLDHDDAGYRKDDDSGWCAPGLTTNQALNNADSYAFFAFTVGSDMGW